MQNQPQQSITRVAEAICDAMIPLSLDERAYIRSAYSFGANTATLVHFFYVTPCGVTRFGVGALNELSAFLELDERVSDEDRTRAPRPELITRPE